MALTCLHAPLPADMDRRLTACLDKALHHGRSVCVFFRADDVAVPSTRVFQLMKVFAHRRVPLALALVPAWLTPPRWQRLKQAADAADGLWCWHQHGWRHVNHEPAGKKQEFGPARSAACLVADLGKGRQRLAALLGPHLTPLFTPPWNRCDQRTLNSLCQMGFKGVSRFDGARPPAPQGLVPLDMDVDLHTRKPCEGVSVWEAILDELGRGLAKDRCGVMIHHQLMTPEAAVFLDLLLAALQQRRQVVLAHIRDLLP